MESVNKCRMYYKCPDCSNEWQDEWWDSIPDWCSKCTEVNGDEGDDVWPYKVEQITVPPALSPDEYACTRNAKRLVCPVCGNSDYDVYSDDCSSPVIGEYNIYTEPYHCNLCEAKWIEVLKMSTVGYREVVQEN